MLDLGCTLFYQVTFDLALTPAGGTSKTLALLAFLRDYLREAWRDGALELLQDDGAWDKLATGGRFSCSAVAGSVRVEAALLRIGEGALQWTCRVAEARPVRGVARRTWHTELCLD